MDAKLSISTLYVCRTGRHLLGFCINHKATNSEYRQRIFRNIAQGAISARMNALCAQS
jgi:hypothetical protein